ncbi:Tyrosine-protein kinase Wzc [Acidisarcina polymorpha]|uniref:Tyrosine-protein kinase Wzc n=1 Tax=Acidisarcina polymorpha TaxID=2211140 RepID=A0A2Z5FXN1_9BACT|nr:Wzz/FepE/Etk N-terminal domain-containing protein [Acidisarcina polymorpha]AXC11264.1 Tyrosine-protein kinase Wzc [Acidisarcina polymorpha]
MSATNGFQHELSAGEGHHHDSSVLVERPPVAAPAPQFASRAIPPPALSPNWVTNASVLWEHRRLLVRVAAVSLILSLLLAFILPKQYKSSASIMPPSNSGASTAMLAALAGRALGGLNGLGGLAGSLLGGNNTTALFVELLRSGTVANHLIDRFDLQHVYRKRYRVDTAKYLARHTTFVEDKKSGVITITVVDTDPRRSRDLAQGYLEELNLLLNRTSTSSAHQERVFIEKRLAKVKADLEQAQQEMSEFSSTHSTVDIKEQTRALVDAAARLQAQMIVEQSSLSSLRQIYGDGNVRVRAAQARIGVLQGELTKMSGTSAPLSTTEASPAGDEGSSNNELYPPLRQLPRLAVPFADLYRKVQVQETVFELLTQQYELARIQEAKDVPVVSVIDSPGIPEKKSFPPRLLLTLLLTLLATAAASAALLFRHRWSQVGPADPRKLLADQIVGSLQARLTNGRSGEPR